jgi:hypothetical protein
MNKSGHMAFAVGWGSVVMIRYALPSTPWDNVLAAMLMAGVALGSLAPDIDHRTSTASKIITPFSAKRRRQLHVWGWLLLLGGVSGFLIQGTLLRITPLGAGPPRFRFIFETILTASPLLGGAGILLLLAARLRDLILLGVGAWLLVAGAIYPLHGFVAFVGIVLMMIPMVKHRGIIHTPEFAVMLTLSGMSLLSGGQGWAAAAMTGFVLGWWLHLAGDVFGEEGIHSLIVPKLRLSLRLFRNGGVAEHWIIRIGWGLAISCWFYVLLSQLKSSMLIAD